MNFDVFIGIIGVIISIAVVVVSDKSKKEKIESIDNSIQNKLNNPFASSEEIKRAYKYETGKVPFNTNHKEGTSLEYKVFKTMYKYNGKVLSNLYVDKIDNTDTEIDVIFVHNTGIYVIECKDRRCLKIVGDEQENQWNCIYSKKFIRKMYNPLKQNLSHIVALKNVLRNKCPHDCYISVIVINCGNVEARYNSNFDTYYQKIVMPNKLKQHIDLLIKNKPRIFSDEEIIDIYKYLHKNYANVSLKVKKAHKTHVQNMSLKSKDEN